MFFETDMDECSSSNGGCDHNCLNLEGSFECSCRDGFVLGEDSMSCEDIDECLTDQCSHTCVNLAGGFRCECPEGYLLDGSGTLCVGMQCNNLSDIAIFMFLNNRYQRVLDIKCWLCS